MILFLQNTSHFDDFITDYPKTPLKQTHFQKETENTNQNQDLTHTDKDTAIAPTLNTSQNHDLTQPKTAIYHIKEKYAEHKCWDPKDAQLCLARLKSGETLMEDRSDSDVQIDRRSWV